MKPAQACVNSFGVQNGVGMGLEEPLGLRMRRGWSAIDGVRMGRVRGCED